jgi:hypothetical protein
MNAMQMHIFDIYPFEVIFFGVLQICTLVFSVFGGERKRCVNVGDGVFLFIFESEFSKQNILRTVCSNYQPFSHLYSMHRDL